MFTKKLKPMRCPKCGRGYWPAKKFQLFCHECERKWNNEWVTKSKA